MLSEQESEQLKEGCACVSSGKLSLPILSALSFFDSTLFLFHLLFGQTDLFSCPLYDILLFYEQVTHTMSLCHLFSVFWIHNAYHYFLVHKVLLSSGHKFVPSSADTVQWNMMTGSNTNVTDFEGQVTACDTMWNVLVAVMTVLRQHLTRKYIWTHIQSGLLLIKMHTCLVYTMFSSHVAICHLSNAGNKDSFSLGLVADKESGTPSSL